MADQTTVEELNRATTALNAVTFAVAYNAYFDAHKERDRNSALIWGKMALEKAGNLGITDKMLSSLPGIRERVADLEAERAAS